MNIPSFRLGYAVALAAVCAMATILPAAAAAGSNDRPGATAHTASSQPCRLYRNVRQLINDVSQVPADSLTLDECSVSLASVCAAEQYNRKHSRNVPFYRSQNFYRSCERAYRFLRSGYLQRSNRAGDCSAIGWAAVLISPFVPVESIGAKLLALAVGVEFKLSGC